MESVPVASPLGEKVILCPEGIPVLGLSQKSIVIASDQGERGDPELNSGLPRRPPQALGFPRLRREASETPRNDSQKTFK